MLLSIRSVLKFIISLSAGNIWIIVWLMLTSSSLWQNSLSQCVIWNQRNISLKMSLVGKRSTSWMLAMIYGSWKLSCIYLWYPLASLLGFHIIFSVIVLGTSGMPSFTNQPAAQKAANVLGTTETELARIIFSPSSIPKTRPSPERGHNDPSLNVSDQTMDAYGCSTYQDALDGFVMGLYVETFSALIRLINR